MRFLITSFLFLIFITSFNFVSASEFDCEGNIRCAFIRANAFTDIAECDQLEGDEKLNCQNKVQDRRDMNNWPSVGSQYNILTPNVFSNFLIGFTLLLLLLILGYFVYAKVRGRDKDFS